MTVARGCGRGAWSQPVPRPPVARFQKAFHQRSDDETERLADVLTHTVSSCVYAFYMYLSIHLLWPLASAGHSVLPL